MAGRTRTVDTGRTRGTRRERTHRPAGESETYRREKEHRGGRAQVRQRLDRIRDPAARLDAARDYVRSALRKYDSPAATAAAVDALLAAGDELYRTGTPKRR